MKQAISRYFGEKISTGGFISWVATAEGEIVATSGLIFFDRPPTEENLSGKEAFVLNMYTHPQWRKKGLASNLLQEIFNFVRETDARHIWLYATKAGQPIYEKAGFVGTKGAMLEMDLIWQSEKIM